MGRWDLASAYLAMWNDVGDTLLRVMRIVYHLH